MYGTSPLYQMLNNCFMQVYQTLLYILSGCFLRYLNNNICCDWLTISLPVFISILHV